MDIGFNMSVGLGMETENMRLEDEKFIAGYVQLYRTTELKEAEARETITKVIKQWLRKMKCETITQTGLTQRTKTTLKNIESTSSTLSG